MSWKNRMPLRLSIQFFAEGSEGGSADGEGAAASNAGGELSSDDLFLAEMEQKYGIANGVAPAEARQKVAASTDSSLRSDKAEVPTGDDTKSTDATADNTTATISPDEEFEQLIKGKYREQYGKRVKSAIDERFKGRADAEAENERLKGVVSMMASKYNLPADDYDGIMAAMEGDDDLYEAEAIRDNITTEQAKQRSKDRRDKKASEAEISRLRSKLDAKDAEDKARADVARWQKESKETVEKYGTFDLRTEIQNPEFLEYLRKGKSVTEAYEHVHMNEIIDARVAAAEKRAREDAARAVSQNRSRITEGARSPHSSPQQRVDLRNMTDEDFDRFDALVRRGVRVDGSFFK